MPISDNNADKYNQYSTVPRPDLIGLRCLILLCLTIFSTAHSPASPDAAGGDGDRTTTYIDSRETYGENSPIWLQAVGKLRVPGKKYNQGRAYNHWEECSATLVTLTDPVYSNTTALNTIVTAWHCLEFYNDLSKDIVFTLAPGTPQSLSITAHIVEKGGAMNTDWAVLHLVKPVDRHSTSAMSIHSGRADNELTVSMAGYSRDSGLGQRGKILSYDPACSITSQSKEQSESNCIAFKGASGGAVVQLSAAGIPQFVGVISQGNGRDISIFIPVERFRWAIKQAARLP